LLAGPALPFAPYTTHYTIVDALLQSKNQKKFEFPYVDEVISENPRQKCP